MTFSHRDYILQGVGIPIFVVALLLFIAIAISKKLINDNGGGAISLIPIAIWLMTVLLGLHVYAEGMEYPLTAWIQAKYPTYIITGEISAIHDAPAPPVYYDRDTRSFTPAKIIVVNNQPYYTLRTDADTGDWVRIAWSTEKRIVYDIKQVSPGEDSVELPVVVQPNTKYEEQLKPNIVAVGEVLRNISFFLCFGIFGLQYPVGRKMAQYFQKKDRFVTECIIPNRYGILWNGVIFAPIFGVLVGFAMAGLQGAGIIAVIGGIGLFAVTLIKQTTTLQMRQSTLIYKVLNSTHIIDTNEIMSVEWGRSSVPFNRRLIIKLCEGKRIVLDQEHHWGIENMFIQLQNLRNNREGQEYGSPAS